MKKNMSYEELGEAMERVQEEIRRTKNKLGELQMESADLWKRRQDIRAKMIKEKNL